MECPLQSKVAVMRNFAAQPLARATHHVSKSYHCCGFGSNEGAPTKQRSVVVGIAESTGFDVRRAGR